MNKIRRFGFLVTIRNSRRTPVPSKAYIFSTWSGALFSAVIKTNSENAIENKLGLWKTITLWSALATKSVANALFCCCQLFAQNIWSPYENGKLRGIIYTSALMSNCVWLLSSCILRVCSTQHVCQGLCQAIGLANKKFTRSLIQIKSFVSSQFFFHFFSFSCTIRHINWLN